MLENLRMQEVSQVVLSVPAGAIIPGKNYSVGEPIMIIENPSLSNLSFLTRTVRVNDAQGHVGESGITKNMEFTINDGTVLFALWSYLYGYVESKENCTIRGVEYLTLENNSKLLKLSQKPNKMYFYEIDDSEQKLIPVDAYEVLEYVKDDNNFEYKINYPAAKTNCSYMASYEYMVQPVSISHIKQIHNNIFCTIDIYIEAVDLKNDDKHMVCIHCDKVQIDTDMILTVNSSNQTSFTPILVQSIPEGDGVDKNVATVVVV